MKFLEVVIPPQDIFITMKSDAYPVIFEWYNMGTSQRRCCWKNKEENLMQCEKKLQKEKYVSNKI